MGTMSGTRVRQRDRHESFLENVKPKRIHLQYKLMTQEHKSANILLQPKIPQAKLPQAKLPQAKLKGIGTIQDCRLKRSQFCPGRNWKWHFSSEELNLSQTIAFWELNEVRMCHSGNWESFRESEILRNDSRQARRPIEEFSSTKHRNDLGTSRSDRDKVIFQLPYCSRGQRILNQWLACYKGSGLGRVPL